MYKFFFLALTLLCGGCEFLDLDDIVGPDEENIPVDVHNLSVDDLKITIGGNVQNPILESGSSHRYNPRIRVYEYSRYEDRECGRIPVFAKNLRLGTSHIREVRTCKDRPGSVEFRDRDFD